MTGNTTDKAQTTTTSPPAQQGTPVYYGPTRAELDWLARKEFERVHGRPPVTRYSPRLPAAILRALGDDVY